MKQFQYIEEDGQRKFVVVPIEVFDRMLEDLDELEDIRAYDRAKAAAQDFIRPRRCMPCWMALVRCGSGASIAGFLRLALPRRAASMRPV